MSFLSDARDLFGTPLQPPPLSASLVLKIEQMAQACRRCVPELCQAVSDGRTIVPSQLTRQEARRLLNDLTREFVSFKTEQREEGKDAARAG